MKLNLDLTKMCGVSYTRPVCLQIDMDTYIYHQKQGVLHQPIGRTRINKELLDEVKKHLVSKHASLLQEAFGNREKKENLRRVIANYISTFSKKNTKGHSLDDLSKDLTNAIAGLDVFDAILEEPGHAITDIIFNGTDIWIQDNKKGRYKSDQRISSDAVAMIAKKIAYSTGNNWTYSAPELEAQLPKLRVHAMHESLNAVGITLALRTSDHRLKINDETIGTKMANKETVHLIDALMKTRANITISGDTGSGKTELAKYMIGKVQERDHVNVLEDTAESNLKIIYPYLHITNWLTRRSDVNNEISFKRLLRSSMRNNPNWIFITETRGAEVYNVLEAGSTGHAIITTLHAHSARDVPERIIDMCQEAVDQRTEVIGRKATSTFDIGFHLELDEVTYERKIVEVVEYIGYKNDAPVTNTIFSYDTVSTEKVEEDGRVYYKPVRRMVQHGTLSDKMADKILRAGFMRPELLQVVSKEWQKKNRIFATAPSPKQGGDTKPAQATDRKPVQATDRKPAQAADRKPALAASTR